MSIQVEPGTRLPALEGSSHVTPECIRAKLDTMRQHVLECLQVDEPSTTLEELASGLRMQLDDPDLLWLFDQLIELSNKIERRMGSHLSVPQPALEDLGERVMRFKQQFFLHKQEKQLQALCGERYGNLLRKAEILDLYHSWEQLLDERGQKISEAYPDRSKLCAAIKIKGLLQTIKESYFISFFAQSHRRERAQQIVGHIARQNLITDLSHLLASIVHKTKTISTRIEEKEAEFATPIGWGNGSAATLFRLGLDHPHVRVATYLVDAHERATQASVFGNVPALRKPLTPFFLTLCKVITAIGLILMDLLVWWWIGFSQMFLRTVSQQLAPRMTRSFPIFHRLGFDEKTAVSLFPLFHEIIDFHVYVGLSRYLDRERPTIEIVLHYTVIRVCRLMSTLLTKRIYRATCKRGECPENSATYPLVSIAVQWVSVYLASRFVWPWARVQWYRVSPPSIMDQKACARWGNICHEAACRSLGVSPTSDRAAIHHAFRAQAGELHPDMETGDAARYIILGRAKELCLEGAS